MSRQNRHKAAKKPARRNPDPALRDALDRAVDGALCARVRLFGLPSLPSEGFDVALRADRDYQQARARLVKALVSLFVDYPGTASKRRELSLEEKVNDALLAAAGVGWKIGVTGSVAARDKR